MIKKLNLVQFYKIGSLLNEINATNDKINELIDWANAMQGRIEILEGRDMN